MSLKFYKIRRKSDGLFWKPGWGTSDFTAHGKVYARKCTAKSAWGNIGSWDKKHKAVNCELVEFTCTESGAEDLK